MGVQLQVNHNRHLFGLHDTNVVIPLCKSTEAQNIPAAPGLMKVIQTRHESPRAQRIGAACHVNEHVQPTKQNRAVCVFSKTAVLLTKPPLA